MNKNMFSSIILFVFMFFTIVYFEILFKIRVLRFEFDGNLFRILVFSLSYTFLFLFLIKFFKTKAAKNIFFTLIFIITFMYFNQEIYKSFVEGFYSVRIAGDFTLGLSFFSDYLNALMFMHIFYFVPVILLYFLKRYDLISFEISYLKLKTPLLFLGGFFILFFVGLQTINEEVDSDIADIVYSDMDLYTYMYNSQDALKKFGLLTYSQRDFFSIFRTDPLTESEYKILLDNFFENRNEHYANTYSRLFKDKNFILITAESLDTFAINEELTPNLYNLKTNYGYFENYYSPLYYRSTADTEFQVQTSTYPDKNVTLSMESYIDNTFPYTMPKMFSEAGYNTYSFHNYTDYFYPRGDFHRYTLGYDIYYGSEELDMLDNPEPGQIINNHTWQSDLELMEKAIPKFIHSDKFFVNMLTVSGHFRYNSTHEIGQKHEDQVRQYEIDNDITLPDEIFWYLAANIELDQAIGLLLDELENAGKMDDTVIMIFGDHYAYGISEETIWEYDDVKEDNDDKDIHNVPMIIVSDSTMFDQPIPNYMSSIDILPTVANLFGLNLNYKHVFGHDALSKDEHIVRFADMSFVAENYSYDSLSEQYDILNEAVTPEYLVTLHHQMINEYMYNLHVLQYDYFKEEEK